MLYPDLEYYKQNLIYLTQIEVSTGIGGTLRFGFNPFELLDFILGWTTIDIFSDDIIKAKKVEIEQNN